MTNDPALQSSHVSALPGLVAALVAERRTEEASAVCERALASNPKDLQAWVLLGQCKTSLGDPIGAERCFRRVIAADGDKAAVWLLLGKALRSQRRSDEALEAFEHAESLAAGNADDLDSFVDVAAAYLLGGRVGDALDVLARNLAVRPSVEGYRAYAEALLSAGRLDEGWGHYEFRWLLEPLLSSRSRSQRPRWAGQPLLGKTILLRYEQGFGDTIQFLRYAPALQSLGATVLLGKFSDLAYRFPGIDRVLEHAALASEFDYYIDLASLPRVFGTGIASLPAAVPYLTASPEKSSFWATRLRASEAFGVALIWAGNPAHPRDAERSIRLSVMSPLLEVEGVRFYSLQKGAAAEELAGIGAKAEVIDLGPELQDFGDTAAVISQVELVICVDTAVAHLAGAMGKPVWLLLPQPADFRWLEGREDSPWYPTMRLFRQKERGDWDEVVARVKAALQERVAAGGMGVEAETKVKGPAEPLRPVLTLPSQAPGHRPGFSAVAECRHGILQYLPDEPLQGDAVGWYGEYLQPQLDLLSRIIAPGSTVMEVGAGIGVHAMFLGRLLGERGHLFLYEAQPVVKRILQQNLGANRIGNYTLMRRMLGRSGESTETLDELRLERLDWLKSNETVLALELLDGAGETLWRLRPRLLLSAPDEAAVSEIAQRVKEFGYRCWRMVTPLFNPDNFNRRENDIFSGRIALAVLAIPEEIEVDLALDHCIEIS